MLAIAICDPCALRRHRKHLSCGAFSDEQRGELRYGTLKTWAGELGLSDAVALLDQTLTEEKKTDATLTEIAESVVNQEAEAA